MASRSDQDGREAFAPDVPPRLKRLRKTELAEPTSRRLLEAIPDAVVIVDSNGRIVSLNAQTEKLFGYGHNELLGQQVEILMPGRFRAAHTRHRVGYHAARRVRPMGARIDKLVGRRKDGSEFPADIALSTLETGEDVVVLAAVRDITERKRAEEALRNAHTGTVLLLATAAEAHHYGTGLHLQSVRALTEALARALDYSEEDANALGLAAVLHDVGKFRVPDSILASSDRLAEEEWELMKQHTTWGAQFLTDRPGFELAATIARSHHERWDGNGYPDSLAADAIPEAATIAAVADAFDAITSDRPYSPRRSVNQAMREIVSGSGTQFSPKVVAALQRLHRRGALSLTATQASEEEEAAA